MAVNDMNPEAMASAPAIAGASGRVATFLRAVYGWMFVGIAVTAVVAGFVAS